jgi:hypothetical protein
MAHRVSRFMSTTQTRHCSDRQTIGWIIALCCVHACLLGYSATRHSPTALEGPLLAAGVSHWELGRFELYRVNPPLVRMVAAMPVMLVGCNTDWSTYVEAPRLRPEYALGRHFIRINGERSFWLMTLARWACIPFSLIGGVFCFLWARELYLSSAAGLWALGLWCFNPVVLGNSELITNDTAAATLGLAACYFYWRWLQSPTWKRSVPAGCLLALAILAKTTWLLLFGLWPLIGLGWFLMMTQRDRTMAKPFASKIAQMLCMFFLGIWIINMSYWFDGSMEEFRSYDFVSDGMTALGDEMPWLRSVPLPFPRQFIIGLDTQISDFEGSYPSSYLAGQWQDSGWRFYYIYGLLVKVPHGTQALFMIVVIASLFARRFRLRPDELALLAPALAVLAVVSSQTAFSHHFRYILPCFGFLCVFLGKVAIVVRNGKSMSTVACSLLTLSIASTMWSYPHSLAYFNESAGGPRSGHKHMLHSSLDWGQDLIYLQECLERHPDIRLAGLAYHGGFEPGDVGSEFPKPPYRADNYESGWCNPEPPFDGPLPGYYALSAMNVWGGRKEYDYFRNCEIFSRAGYSIYIYRITLEEANLARRELGLPELGKDWERGRDDTEVL